MRAWTRTTAVARTCSSPIVDLMLAAGIRHLPVLADGRPVGMVSTRDIVVAARALEEPGPPTTR